MAETLSESQKFIEFLVPTNKMEIVVEAILRY